MSEASSGTRAASPVRAEALGWLALAALALFAWREGLRFALSEGGEANLERLLFDAADNPPWLISIVSAALLASRWRDVRAAVSAPGSALGSAALLAPGLALLAWGRLTQAADLALLGSIAMAIGAAWAAFGARLARLVALPLALLGFSVPAPGALVNQVVYPLQLVTSEYAAALVAALGITAVQTADVIVTASHTFLVIEGCSGLGSIEVLTLLALAWAWQVKASLWRGAVLALAAPVIAFVLNGFRILALILYPDSELLSGHTMQGVVAFAIGALGIAMVDRFLEPRDRPAAQAALAPAARPARARWALAAWLVAAAVASIAIPRTEVPNPTGPRELWPAADPSSPWVAKDLAIDKLFLGSVHPRDSAVRRYELAPDSSRRAEWGTEPVTASILVGDYRHRITSLLSPKTLIPGRGWTLVDERPEDLPGRFTGKRTLAELQQRTTLSRVIELGLASPSTESVRALFALDQSPFRRKGLTYVVRLSTEIAPRPGGKQRAERRLYEVGRLLRDRLDAFREAAGG